ncbi:sulfur carrier protein ThiS [Kroppenstedtia eburnea]|uniref:Sulfur carrier protein n=1 Tax=Kroppenstedtia eburnea TaxID=714067 RepID=A0A1N7PS61_9BACL|nr:sulfur carrier protein ThiS [Kroppenstedtia eburnea]EGK12807.1 thiamine biosynthesis protein ThiS [Desmospora sp. 8437]QKI82683.1 sulfur carrier protein ThiS [Kroppenstedtia eburnea]SIT13406.1 sulfur carrier protein [Kroppenstedtia eburnea]
MNIQLNGKQHDVPESICDVEALITHLGLSDQIVVVEKNRKILDRDQYGEVRLEEGDRLEIVQFVGGG